MKQTCINCGKDIEFNDKLTFCPACRAYINIPNKVVDNAGFVVTGFNNNIKTIQYGNYGFSYQESLFIKGTGLDIPCHTRTVNGLTRISPHQYWALERLTCLPSEHNKSVLSIDVSWNTRLRELSFFGFPISSIDVSNNPALKELDCGSNQLTTLNVNNNTELKELDCSYNLLTTLDLGYNTVLKKLNCRRNQISILDLSKNTALEDLSCSENPLQKVILSMYTKIPSYIIDNLRKEYGRNIIKYVY